MTPYLDQNSQAARAFFREISNLAKTAKSWDAVVFYDIKPDEIFDPFLVSRRIYGRPDEYLAVMAAAGIDTIDVGIEQKQIILPNEAKLRQIKEATEFESQERFRKDGKPRWSKS